MDNHCDKCGYFYNANTHCACSVPPVTTPATPDGVLPELPEPKEAWLPTHTMDYYTADDMHAYAREYAAALEQREAEVLQLTEELRCANANWQAHIDALRAEKSRATAAESRLREVEAGVLALIPTNWCDPMLTGDTAALGPNPWGCPDIERLLGAIRNRITDFFKGVE